MAMVDCRHRINAPIEDVFEAITDHAGYQRVDGVVASSVIKPGDRDPNGTGAVRDITAFGIRFVEDITGYRPPTRINYLVRECYLSFGENRMLVRFPLMHELGEITLREEQGATVVRWVSRFSVDLPFGNLVAAGLAPRVERGFYRILEGLALRLKKGQVTEAHPAGKSKRRPAKVAGNATGKGNSPVSSGSETT